MAAPLTAGLSAAVPQQPVPLDPLVEVGALHAELAAVSETFQSCSSSLRARNAWRWAPMSSWGGTDQKFNLHGSFDPRGRFP